MKPEDITPELLQWLKEIAEKAEGFVERDAPLLSREIVAWEFWSSMAGVGLGLAMLLVAVLGVKAYLYYSTKYPHPHAAGVPEYVIPAGEISLILAAVMAIISPLVISANCYRAVKASTAPRLVVLENVGKLLK